MFAKLMIITLLLACLAGGLLGLRQQRLQFAHDNAALHARIAALRADLWEAQVRAAESVQPDRLRQSLDRARLALEPDAAAPGAPETRFARLPAADASRP